MGCKGGGGPTFGVQSGGGIYGKERVQGGCRGAQRGGFTLGAVCGCLA